MAGLLLARITKKRFPCEIRSRRQLPALILSLLFSSELPKGGLWGVPFSSSFFAMSNPFDSYDAEHLRKLPYEEFLLTDYWKEVSQMVRERDGHRCRICNASKRIEVHHRTYQHHGSEHFHLDDLTTLCHVCHNRHHFPPKPVEPRVVVKTVVQFREVGTDGGMLWSVLSKKEKRFFRKAAIKLRRKAKKLCLLGREKVSELLSQPLPPVIPQVQNPPRPRLNGYILVGDISSADADMPEGNEILLTKQLLNKCRANGAFTSATVKAFGLNPGSLEHGWAQTLIGLTIPREKLLEALRGRHLYSPSSFKR